MTEPKRRPRKTKAQRAAEAAKREERDRKLREEAVVRWATVHGAPIAILEGWNPDDGTWEKTSPIGKMLAALASGNYLSVAASWAGVPRISQMVARGHDYAMDASENRELIDIDHRVFVDLVRQIDVHESHLEVDLVDRLVKMARQNPDLIIKFLERRFGSRWRHQTGVFVDDDPDEREAFLAEAVNDPNTAMHLAKAAEHIERQRPEDTID